MDWTKNSDLLVSYIENHYPTPIISLDEQGIIMECNVALHEILGQREKPIGQNIKNFLVVDTVSQFTLLPTNGGYINTSWHFRTPNNVSSFNCHILRRDSQIIVFTEKPLITGDTIIAQMGAINLEITDISREFMRKNAEMEKSNRSLQEEISRNVLQVERLASLAALSAGIAHEITQPLNSLKLAADSVLYYHKQGKSLLMSDILEYMKNISNQAKNIDGIIRHIRALVNNEPIDMVACDLNTAIRDTLPVVQSLAEDRGVMVTSLLSAQNLVVLGNRVGLSEIVLNLTNNSVIALQTAEIAEKKIILKSNQKNDKIVLEITDNGSGIPEKFREKFFEPFFTSAGKRGMGLGLSIVKAIVTAHNGTIEVQSEVGKGTTFVVTLPLYQGTNMVRGEGDYGYSTS